MGIRSTMLRCGAVTASATLLLCCQPVQAEDFYAGKSIEVLIGSGVGGGYDRYARTVLHHMVKRIPGHPTYVPRNMPGAGSMKTAEYLSTMAPKDGTTIALLQPGALFEPLVNDKLKFRYDPAKLEMIGSANSGTRVCVTFHKSKIKTFDDALKTITMMGGNSPGSSTTDYSLMLNHLAGAKLNVVDGYNSTSLIVLAMERGELDGVCGFDTASFASQKPDWYATDLSHMILQVGIDPDPELEKIGVPSIWKYVHGRNRQVAELILSQQEFHRPFVAPPGTGPGQLAILRRAFNATMQDPEFLADAKRAQLDIAPKTGEVIDGLIKKVYAAPKDLIDEARKALGR
jgi:tripartite-type tricarboxylate transporter receptor subunit TctC